jgi:hypothetical protein
MRVLVLGGGQIAKAVAAGTPARHEVAMRTHAQLDIVNEAALARRIGSSMRQPIRPSILRKMNRQRRLPSTIPLWLRSFELRRRHNQNCYICPRISCLTANPNTPICRWILLTP